MEITAGSGVSAAQSFGAITVDDAYDRALAQRIWSGDVEALGELFDRLGAMALRVAASIVTDRALAEGIVHDAFLTVWQKIDEFDARFNTLAAWVMAFTRKLANAAVALARLERPGPDRR